MPSPTPSARLLAPAVPVRPPRRIGRRLRLAAVSVVSAIGFIGLWEILAVTGVIDARFFPPPSHLVDACRALLADGTLQNDILASTVRVLIGFFCSAAIGVPLGLLLGTAQVLRWLLQPFISIMRPLPSLAWIPLSLLWLGIGESEKYAIVFMGTLTPLVVYSAEAASRVEPLYVRAAQNLGAGRLTILAEVILPGALPSIVSALKVTLALAWTCIVSAEMVGANNGLGYLIWNAQDYSNVAQVVVGMLAISVTVLVLDGLVRAIESRAIPWQRSLVEPGG
jgi:taurine transport system permease protein